jgi:hypothetical protein
MDGIQLQTLTPTERLIFIVLRESVAPMTLFNLCESTGASAATLADSTQRLARQGLLIRTRVGGVSYFALPAVSL